jgi:hypothetical protein
MFRVSQDDLIGDGTNHRIRSILAQMSGGAGSSGSKRIFEVVCFAVLFRGGVAGTYRSSAAIE